jgi:hypothetical protein
MLSYSAPMTTRVAALLVGLSFLARALPAVAAESPLLHPSARALAAADEDEPPPHEDPRAVKKQVVKAAPVEEAPVYKKWWFWALTAAVVGAVTVVGISTFKPAPHTPMACQPGTLTCFGDGRPI